MRRTKVTATTLRIGYGSGTPSSKPLQVASGGNLLNAISQDREAQAQFWEQEPWHHQPIRLSVIALRCGVLFTSYRARTKTAL
ncbi:hypothetical protein IG631_01517 [Alternaria alternata]|nr:hypothetical protein IG631_01517 [Alternaria alternata]